jgi:hypothetical protein
MISTESAALAIAVAKGIIKLAGRMDRLMAEKGAVQGDLVIPMPPESEGPDRETRNEQLRKYLKDTADDVPDPLGTDRQHLRDLLAKDPVPDESDLFFTRLFPEQDSPAVTSPDAAYVAALRRYLPTANWDEKTNQDMLKAAFYIATGRDERGLGYSARVGLLVADVLAEFGAENTALFVRDSNAQGILQSVLENFAKPDLEGFEDWSPFLRHALGATLNGLLDSRAVLAGHAKWAEALLGALALARAGSTNPDNYLVGLLNGSGYSLLIGEGLKLAGQQLSEGQTSVFKDMAADFLIEAAPLVQANKQGFGDFFKDHWGDMLRGGLSAAAKHSPALLEGKSPLAQQTLLAVMNKLATVPGTDYFTADTAFHLAEAALGSVASDPSLLKGNVGDAWLRELIKSVAGTLSDSGLRESFSNAGLERIFAHALETFAQHPELIIKQPGLAQDVVAGVLTEVSLSGSLAVESLAEAAVNGALEVLVQHPDLLDTKFGPYLGEVAGLLSKAVADKGLTSLQAADLVSVGAEAMARNPELFAKLKDNLSVSVLNAVLQATDKSQLKLVAGDTLIEVAHEVLGAVACNGASLAESKGVDNLGATIEEALAASLTLAEKELGRQIDRSAVPSVLGGVVQNVLRGELTDLDPKSKNFQKLFETLAVAATA